MTWVLAFQHNFIVFLITCLRKQTMGDNCYFAAKFLRQVIVITPVRYLCSMQIDYKYLMKVYV